ncbi:hypothetical protein [Mycobacterium vicinigordonae]|uniref:Uncharacterized protein n=1 Tax=Mycobacterium vicinigordonae TaxID=1719132 RepID=A0A7D6HU24_9MYCO|nr:hypothetical protein [Mycobacterium vicinigordonae]QLL09951.1 hypothetical protein H0P51_02795 [Mycobacterium vicinigordonae]
MTPDLAQPVYRRQSSAASKLVRELVFPILGVAAIVGYADVRIPMGLPGHRGLIWLTLLVAVALATQRRATVIAVGAAATVATLAMPGSTRYLAAAVLLYAVATTVWRSRHRGCWVALAAAPIHLVALAGGAWPTEKVWLHLGFGLIAGLLGWAIASVIVSAVPRP